MIIVDDFELFKMFKCLKCFLIHGKLTYAGLENIVYIKDVEKKRIKKIDFW